jgi:adsorption protein B
VAALGGRGAFVRRRAADGSLIATREYFPATLSAAIAQKSRWMTGIALAGWDRLGWRGGLAERWMRLRDRQGLLAALLLVAGYAAALLWLGLKAREGLTGHAPAPLPPALATVLSFNFWLVGWRLFVRAAFVTHAYGWLEGARSVPRALVGNLISILAAGAALGRYRALRRTGRARWGKTAHRFPDPAAAE